MTPLAARLKARIEAVGPISVEAWMQACLADPEYGYYLTRDPLGRTGDFTTAPEISQMFGELLGLWAAVVWQAMGTPAAVNLIELGPGRGTLMADALRAAKGAPAFIAALHVHMVESSPVLRDRQRQALAAAVGAPAWHASLDTVPHGPGIVLANEFLDALPVRQSIYTDGVWHERTVTVDGTGFAYGIGRPVDLADIPTPFHQAAEGAIYEDAPAVRAIVAALGRRVVADGGAVLLIDYGYAERCLGETLQAVRGHAFADPLADPGAQDLTAHVNFGAVAEIASAVGARVWGPVEQGGLLERLGIAARAAALLGRASAAQAVEIGSARRRLVDADAMGRLFKALVIADPALPAPPGFEEVRWA